MIWTRSKLIIKAAVVRCLFIPGRLYPFTYSSCLWSCVMLIYCTHRNTIVCKIINTYPDCPPLVYTVSAPALSSASELAVGCSPKPNICRPSNTVHMMNCNTAAGTPLISSRFRTNLDWKLSICTCHGVPIGRDLSCFYLTPGNVWHCPERS